VLELLKRLPGGVVLDLGCGSGTFDAAGFPGIVVRLDLERHPDSTVSNFIQADAAKLPFVASQFDLLISNNSLEHVDDLESALREVGRVIKPSGALYVAVPDAGTLCDRLYRWLARGGGHVNPFLSAKEFASQVAHATGLAHVATRTLCTSFSFLNRRNRRTRGPRRLLLLGGGTQTSLLLASYFLRQFDRWLGTRSTVYGWAFYFGNVDSRLVDQQAWTNVCIRCGAGHRSDWLRDQNLVERLVGLQSYWCPCCETRNMFTEDGEYRHFDAGA
jgi:SAM-dependent methyltransferase